MQYIASGQVIGEHMASFLLLLSSYLSDNERTPGNLRGRWIKGPGQEGPRLQVRYPLPSESDCVHYLVCRGSFPGAVVGRFLPAAETSFPCTALQLGDFVFFFFLGEVAP